MIEVPQDAFDELMECAVAHAMLVSDAHKERVAAILADHAGDLGPTARRVIAGQVVEHDSHPCWRPALRALSRR